MSNAPPADAIHNAPPRWGRPSVLAWGAWLVVLALVVHGLMQTDLSPNRLLDGVVNMGAFAAEALPPNFSRWQAIGWAMLLTLEMAIIGVGLGIVVSLPLSLTMARATNTEPISRGLIRTAVTVCRTVPDLVWAMIFVVAVGLGPLAGILAIAIDTVGFCARFFAQRIEDTPTGPLQALSCTGARWTDVIGGAILPDTLPSLAETSLYALEKAVRSAVVLGLVGAGGIGIELSAAMDLYRYDQALTVILVILAVVAVMEQGSTAIRKRLR